MEFRVLGPLEGSGRGRAVSLGPRKQRALLARLLLDANRTVAVERLLDDLWGDDLPESAVKMVQVYVSGLRKVLPDGMLCTRPPGYALEVDPEAIDLHRFERLRAEASAAIAAGAPGEAARALHQALGLWRGPALAEFNEPFAVHERGRLEELRIACLEERIDADLALGRHADVVPELESLVSQEPLRERLRGQLMLALYRCGRQADALAGYREYSRTVGDELGIEPSPRLRELERSILMQAPELEPGRPAPPLADAPGAKLSGETAHATTGRAAELERLRRALARMLEGDRRAVFVTGEPGAGKTTLVGAFVDEVTAEDILVAQGQCVEHRGAGEPYLPVLDALGRAADGPYGNELVEALAERALSWIVQLPWLIDFDYLEAVERRVRGTTRERMLREAVEALEVLAARRPLLLVLEDLQWTDGATLDLLSALMRRSGPARILVVATSSPPGVLAGEDRVRSLVHELCLRGAAEELPLTRLGEDAVEQYLEARLGGAAPPGLAALVHERTGGNLLFMRHLLDHWLDEGAVVKGAAGARLTVPLDQLASAVPGSLRASIENAVAGLGPRDAALLHAAALAGREFAVAAVAAALERPTEEVTARCAALARMPALIEPSGEARWPDGTVTPLYAFVHDLHRAVLGELVPPGKRAEAHRRIGARLLVAHGARAEDIATELAFHFVAGRDPERAVRFLKLAADRALARLAYAEGIEHVREALRAVVLLEAGPSRDRTEMELLSMLGQAVVATEGWSSPEAEESLVRAKTLAEKLHDNEPLITVLLALATLYEVRGDYETAAEVVEESRRLTPADDVSRHLQSQELLACSLFHQGSFARALEHADGGAALFAAGDPAAGGYDTFPATMGDNAGVSCHDWAALATWYLGRPDDALERARRALALAEEPARAYSRATACAQLAVVHQCRREPEQVREWAHSTIEASRERGYVYRVAMGRVLEGWALAVLGEPERGIEELVCGLQASRITGAHMDDPYYLGLLADAYLQEGELEAGLSAVSEALELGARERSQFFEAELLRLRALLLLARDPDDVAAEQQLESAVAVARRQGSPALELRAAVALARVWLRRGRAGQARGLVAAARERWTEGLDTPDLREAAALLGDGGVPLAR
jgi:DNA-binding SARP family transcriptional activator/predicted ATPase